MADARQIGGLQKANETTSLDKGRPRARLLWLDIVRLLCALQILGIHWLRACFKVGAFGTHDRVSLVMDYQGQSKGLGMLPYVLIGGTGHSISTWLTNVIGLLGGFGWEGVSALVIVSGFSLTVAIKNRPFTRNDWFVWFKRRAVRILVPFYLVALPFLVGYVCLLAVVSHMHGSVAAGLDHKLHSLLQTPPLGVIFSHTLFFDPFEPSWQPVFFAPAWWFIPAILVAYLAFPLIVSAVRRCNMAAVLTCSAVITILAYTLADNHVIANENWYFIVLQESFNLTLGVVIGQAWLAKDNQQKIASFIFSSKALVAGLAIFALGNILNWSPTSRPFASMLYGPGLLLMITVVAKRIENWRIARIAIKVDAYDLYLVHQPFAFPLALASLALLHGYAVFVGWFGFLLIAAVAALMLAFVQRIISRLSTAGRSTGLQGASVHVRQ